MTLPKDTFKEYKKKSTEDLVIQQLGTNKSREREDISLEMSRRLVKSINDFNKNSEKHNKEMGKNTRVMKNLTIALCFFTGIIIILMSFQIWQSYQQSEEQVALTGNVIEQGEVQIEQEKGATEQREEMIDIFTGNILEEQEIISNKAPPVLPLFFISALILILIIIFYFLIGVVKRRR